MANEYTTKRFLLHRAVQRLVKKTRNKRHKMRNDSFAQLEDHEIKSLLNAGFRVNSKKVRVL